MIGRIARYSFIFLTLILIQVLILNNLHLSIFINPFVYILFILILPFETPGWLVLSLGFATGLIMDSTTNTLGMHTSATVFLAFCRQYLLRLIAPRDGYEPGQSPHYSELGIVWFLIYAGILIVAHHLFLFFAEDFRLDRFFTVLLKSLLSGLLSLILITLFLLFSYKPDR